VPWLTPVIPATQEAEIRRIVVPSQPQQIVRETLSCKHPFQKALVEWLKVQALSLNPGTTNNNKILKPVLPPPKKKSGNFTI
jgi:hypothetical protein